MGEPLREGHCPPSRDKNLLLRDSRGCSSSSDGRIIRQDASSLILHVMLHRK